jgi:hypothetical protein
MTGLGAQHTPLSLVIDGATINIHDVITEFVELDSLERLGEEVTNHLLGRAVLDSQLTGLDSVRNKEVLDIHVATLFTSGSMAILLQ